jgi:cyclopropane-fatty-acyl-phospholipid synthase
MQEVPMLFEFKSRATGSVVMTSDVGKKVLPLIGKSADAQGIITVDQMPAAINALEAACKRENELAAAARDKAKSLSTRAQNAAVSQPDSDNADNPDDDPHLIGICQRVYPLIEMLKASHSAGKDITWGV